MIRKYHNHKPQTTIQQLKKCFWTADKIQRAGYQQSSQTLGQKWTEFNKIEHYHKEIARRKQYSVEIYSYVGTNWM